MNTKDNAAKKTVNAKVNNTKKSTSKVVDLNLSKFANQLKDVQLKEKKDKETLYIYPDGFSKTDINSEKGKKFRNSLRTKIQKFANNIFVFTKTEQQDKLIEEIKLFDVFYKANYKTNDYTVKSVSSSNNELKNADFNQMFDIIKHVKQSNK